MPFVEARRTELGIVLPVASSPSPSAEAPRQHAEQKQEQENRQQRAEEPETPRTVVVVRVVRIRHGRWNRLSAAWSTRRTYGRWLHGDAARHPGLIRRCADCDR